MSENLGMKRPGSTFQVYFNTFDSNDPSASVAIAAFVLTDVHIYKDGGTTQRASDSGVTLLDTDGIDFDGHVGIGGIQIVLSDNDTADFYTAGSKYSVVIGPTTVDAAVVNFVAATFEIGYPDAILNTTIATLASQTSFTINNAPTDDNALVGFPCVVHDVASATQFAVGYVSAYTTAANTITLKADPGVFTMAAGDNISFFMPANVQAVAGTTQTANDVGADTDAILTDTTEIGAAGAGLTEAGGDGDHLTAIPATVDWLDGGRLDVIQDAIKAITDQFVFTTANEVDSSPQSMAAGAVTAAAIATDAIDADALAADAIDEIYDEAMTETGGPPAVTASFRDAWRWMFALSRNKITQTATTMLVRNDADAATLGTSTVSDDGTTAIRGEFS